MPKLNEISKDFRQCLVQQQTKRPTNKWKIDSLTLIQESQINFYQRNHFVLLRSKKENSFYFRTFK